jgi:flagellar motility protein MotE (MotC chaperone)
MARVRVALERHDNWMIQKAEDEQVFTANLDNATTELASQRQADIVRAQQIAALDQSLATIGATLEQYNERMIQMIGGWANVHGTVE